MLKVVVREKEWLQGEYDSMLLRPKDGKMCCLGFVCETVGVERENFEGVETLSRLTIPELPAGLEGVLVETRDEFIDDDEPVRIDLPITEDLMSVNDTISVGRYKQAYPASTFTPTYPTGWSENLIGKPIDPDEQKFYAMKKARIKELGLQAGIDFEFVAE